MRRTKQEAEKTRLRLIRSAVKCFYEFGYSETRLKEIAADAGTTRGAIYWHFQDKPGVYFSVVSYCFDTMEKVIEDAVAQAETSGTEKIVSCINAVFDVLDSDPCMYMIFEMIMRREDASVGSKSVTNRLHKRVEALWKNIEKLALNEVPFESNAQVDSFMIGVVSQVTGIFRIWIEDKKRFSLSANGKNIFNCFVNGFMNMHAISASA